MSHQKHFGKFHHIGEFLNHYKKWENNKIVDQVQQEHPGNVKAQSEKMNKLKTEVVELEATIVKFFGDQNEHYQFYIDVTELLTPCGDDEINSDVKACIANKTQTFLAVRYGDNEGLSQPIHEEMNTGTALHLKGQWITAANAFSHNGEKMPVLHFTHHPIGFICVANDCYS